MYKEHQFTYVWFSTYPFRMSLNNPYVHIWYKYIWSSASIWDTIRTMIYGMVISENERGKHISGGNQMGVRFQVKNPEWKCSLHLVLVTNWLWDYKLHNQFGAIKIFIYKLVIYKSLSSLSQPLSGSSNYFFSEMNNQFWKTNQWLIREGTWYFGPLFYATALWLLFEIKYIDFTFILETFIISSHGILMKSRDCGQTCGPLKGEGTKLSSLLCHK